MKRSGDRRKVHEHSDQENAVSNRLVVWQPSEAAEEIGPIVFAPTHERKFLGARVANVHRDIPQVLANPPEDCERGDGLSEPSATGRR